MPDTVFHFTKMHGLGNDFVVINGLNATATPTKDQLHILSDRRQGVGCDQILLINPANSTDEDVSLRIFNADGSEAGQCGNGVRCVAAWLIHNRPIAVQGDYLRIGTTSGVVRAKMLNADHVQVTMAVPRLEPADIPFDAPQRALTYAVEVKGRSISLGAVSMGNPHAIINVPDVLQAPVADIGPSLVTHPRFAQGVNAGFLQIVDRQQVRLRVFERGAGETLACGTGACAAVVWGRLAGLLDEQVNVTLPGGELVISWRAEGEPVFMTGPAVTVFEGQITL